MWNLLIVIFVAAWILGAAWLMNRWKNYPY